MTSSEAPQAAATPAAFDVSELALPDGDRYELSSGASAGETRIGFHSKQMLAVKRVRADGASPGSVDALRKHLRRLAVLAHDSLVPLHGTFTLGGGDADELVWVAYGYMPASVADLLDQEKRAVQLTEAEVVRYALQIAQGLTVRRSCRHAPPLVRVSAPDAGAPRRQQVPHPAVPAPPRSRAPPRHPRSISTPTTLCTAELPRPTCL